MKHSLIRTVPEAPQEAFAGCGHGPAPAARRAVGAPPIYVDGVHIAESAIAAEAQHHVANSGAEARAAAARALVIRHLLLRRARELNLEPEPLLDGEGREETADEALIRQVLAIEAPGEEPSEIECRRVYDTSKQRFSAPEIFEASHILIEFDGPGASGWVAAHQRAKKLIGQLLAGADFAQLARAHSACPTSSEGGALGQLTRGDVTPDFERALLSLRPGLVVAAPVRSRHGWHVVRLDRYAPPQVLPFDAVRDAIAASLRARSAVAMSARYVERLASGVCIEGLSLTGSERANA